MKHDALCERGQKTRPFDCGCGSRMHKANPYREDEDPPTWPAPGGVNLDRWWVGK